MKLDNLSEKEKITLELIKKNNEHKYCVKDDVDFLLNLIEKQQKEIEELKAINQMQKYSIEVEKNDNKYNKEETCEETIPKYRIKEIIGEKMQINNNIIHNGKKKYGKDYLYYDDVREARFLNSIYKEILEKLRKIIRGEINYE